MLYRFWRLHLQTPASDIYLYIMYTIRATPISNFTNILNTKYCCYVTVSVITSMKESNNE